MKLRLLFLLILASLQAQAQFYAPYNPLNGNGHPRYFGMYNYDSTLAWDVEQMHLVSQTGGYTVFAAEPQFASFGVSGGFGTANGSPWYGDTVSIHPNGRVYYSTYYRQSSFWINPAARLGDTLYCSPVHPVPGGFLQVFRVDTVLIEAINGALDTVKVSFGEYSRLSPQNWIRLHRTQGWITTPPPYMPNWGNATPRFAEGSPGFPIRYLNYSSQEALSFSIGDQAGFMYRLSPENNGFNGGVFAGYMYEHLQRILAIDTVSADSLLVTVQDSSQLVHRSVIQMSDSTGLIQIDTLDTMRLGIRPSRFGKFDGQPFDTIGSSSFQGFNVYDSIFATRNGPSLCRHHHPKPIWAAAAG